jgi:hypothetical protein
MCWRLGVRAPRPLRFQRFGDRIAGTAGKTQLAAMIFQPGTLGIN